MSVYSIINPTMNRLLRSRWHRLLSKRVMIVSYQGRKSGRHFDTPVSYYRGPDHVYCFTNGNWRHNFTAESAVTLRIFGRDYEAIGNLCADNQQRRIDIMSAYFKAVPQDKKFYGVTCGSDGEPVRAEVAQALRSIDIIEFTLL